MQFFHALVNSSAMNKNIEMLSIDGSMAADRDRIRAHMKSSTRRCITSQSSGGPLLVVLILKVFCLRKKQSWRRLFLRRKFGVQFSN